MGTTNVNGSQCLACLVESANGIAKFDIALHSIKFCKKYSPEDVNAAIDNTVNTNQYPAKEYDLNDYQSDAAHTAVYPGQHTAGGITYTILGLVGECGELTNKWKKFLRDIDTEFFAPDELETYKQQLRAELGDVLWYITMLASELNTTLGEVAGENVNKLQSRNERGVIGGSGDNR